MANTYLEKAKTGTDGDRQIWTISVWVKRAKLGFQQKIINFGENVSSEGNMYFDASDFLVFQNDGHNGSSNETDMVFRDTNAWYHLVWACDSTQADNANRWKVYVNGSQVTLTGSPAITQDGNGVINAFDAHDCWIGRTARVQQSVSIADDYFDGQMAHFHFIDGTQYAATDFGQTDSTTGEWVPKASPSVTYGTNGFFLKFENSGSMGTDSSGNGNNLTVNGTMTQTIDTPTHNFCTLNPLIPHGANLTFSNGNLSLATSSSQWQGALASIAPNGGKYYFEAKYNTGTGIKLDIARADADIRNMTVTNNSYLSYVSTGYGYQLNNSGTDYYCSNNTCTTWSSSRGNSTKIIMVALDIDNGKMWVGDSGTWYNKSGTANPETGADPLHDFSSDLNGENWFINMSCEGSGTAHILNFGGGFFGTTAVSSAGTNASGIGTFEYNVPSGYTALTSKGLNE